MTKFIEVYDDIISKKLADSIEHYAIERTLYKYLPNIATNLSSDYNPGFSRVFLRRSLEEYTPECFYFSQILYNFCQYKKINLYNITAGRLFLHIPTSTISTPDNIHTDSQFPHWVCLYYVNDSDGDTILYEDDEKTEIKRVTPKKGRIVFFDGSIKHCSSKPTKTHRSVINFNFNGEYFDK